MMVQPFIDPFGQALDEQRCSGAIRVSIMMRDDRRRVDKIGRVARIGSGVTAGDQNFRRNGWLVATFAWNSMMKQTRWIAGGWRLNEFARTVGASAAAGATNGLAALRRRGVRHAAGMDDLQVCGHAFSGRNEPAFAQECFDLARFGVVDPAAERLDSERKGTHGGVMLVGDRAFVSGRDRSGSLDSGPVAQEFHGESASRCGDPFAIIHDSRRFGAFALQRSIEQDSEYPTPWQ